MSGFISRDEANERINSLLRKGYEEIEPLPLQKGLLKSNARNRSAYRYVRCFRTVHDGLLREQHNFDFGNCQDTTNGRLLLSKTVNFYVWYKLVNLTKLVTITSQMNFESRERTRTVKRYMRDLAHANTAKARKVIENRFNIEQRRNFKRFDLMKYSSFLNAITIGDDENRGFRIFLSHNRAEAAVYFTFLKELSFYGGRFRDDRRGHERLYSNIGELAGRLYPHVKLAKSRRVGGDGWLVLRDGIISVIRKPISDTEARAIFSNVSAVQAWPASLEIAGYFEQVKVSGKYAQKKFRRRGFTKCDI